MYTNSKPNVKYPTIKVMLSSNRSAIAPHGQVHEDDDDEGVEGVVEEEVEEVEEVKELEDEEENKEVGGADENEDILRGCVGRM